MSDSSKTILIDRGQRVPYLDQWFGYWLIEPQVGLRKAEMLAGMNIAVHLQAGGAVGGGPAGGAAAAANDGTVAVRRGYAYELVDGVAVVELEGSLMKHEASDESSTSTVMMRNTVRKMMTDEAVKAVLFKIDSPGGTVAGAYELADDIAALAAKKPTAANIANLGASAAFLQAAMTGFISAHRTALVGSIGTVGVVADYSARATMMGIKVYVLGTGKYKGAGTPGSDVTPDQLDRWKQEIDALNAHFLEAVSRGRKMAMNKVEAIADGSVCIAAKAKEMGLIDAVESFDQTLARIVETVNGRPPGSSGGARVVGSAITIDDAKGQQRRGMQSPPRGEQQQGGQGDYSKTDTAAEDAAASSGASAPPAGAVADADLTEVSIMETNKDTAAAGGATTAAANAGAGATKPATMAELKAACPGAPSDFLVEQCEKNATADQAVRAYVEFQNAQIRSRDEDLKKLQESGAGAGTGTAAAAAAGGALRKPGVEAIGGKQATGATAAAAGGAGAGSGDAIERFNAQVDEQMTKPGFSNRKKAISAVCRRDPALHQEYLEATNPGVRQRALIGERFGN